MKSALRYFLARMTAGFVVFLPIATIVFLVAKVLAALRGVSEELAASLPEERLAAIPVVTVLSVLGLVLIVCLLGALVAPHSRHSSGTLLERKFLSFVPGYSLIKGTLVGALGVEFEGEPKAGALRRQTGVEELVLILQELEDGRRVVFLPSAPSPGTGKLLLVDGSLVQPLETSVAALPRVFSDWGMGVDRVLTPSADRPRR